MTYLEFIHGTLGPNWVVARRTPRILAKYGEDVVCISKKRIHALDKEFRRLYGDPYDKVRAQMYRALLAMLEAKRIGELGNSEFWVDVEEAVAAEQERP